MLQTDIYYKQLSDIKSTIDDIREALDVEALKSQLDAIRKEMEAPGFWDNVSHANKVNQKVKPLEDKLDTINSLTASLDDVSTLIDLAVEESDDSLAGEIETELNTLEQQAQDAKLKALFKGRI